MIIITKIKQLFSVHRIFFSICLFLPVYHLLIVNNGAFFYVNEIPYSFYAVDYSMGFCSRFFLGEVYHLIVGVYDKNVLAVYLTFFYAAFVILLAYLTERFILAFPEYRRECFVLVVLFLTGPFTFAMFIKDFGMVDFAWAFLLLVSCCLLQNRYLKYLVPVMAGLMILINFGSLICYATALLIIILFFAFRTNVRRERAGLLIVFALSLFACIGIFLYFFFNDTKNLTYSMEEFHRILAERNAVSFYYDWHCYKFLDVETYPFYQRILDIPPVDPNAHGLQKLLDTVVYFYKCGNALRGDYRTLLLHVLSVLCRIPAVCVLYQYIKKSDAVIKKLIAVCMIALPCVNDLYGILIANDNSRWAGNSVLLGLAFFMLILYYDYREGMATVKTMFLKLRYWLIYVFLFFYSCLIVDPYAIMSGVPFN